MKKKRFMIIVVLLFFLVSGFWYLLKEKEEQTELPNSIFSQATLEENVVTPKEDETFGEEKEETKEDIIFVHICGAVNSPGVYELAASDRVYRVIELAGGFTKEAAKEYHNLARVVEDGERIYILTKEELAKLSLEEQIEGEKSTKQQDLVNINTASLEELTTLSGIGGTRAESIIEYRTKVGKFTSIEEIMNISGIGESMFEKIKDRITIE